MATIAYAPSTVSTRKLSSSARSSDLVRLSRRPAAPVLPAERPAPGIRWRVAADYDEWLVSARMGNRRSRPIAVGHAFAQERTLAKCPGQERLFDHVVGSDQHRLRDLNAEILTRVLPSLQYFTRQINPGNERALQCRVWTMSSSTERN